MYRLPPLLTASTWKTLVSALAENQMRRQGVVDVVVDNDTKSIPILTNREATAVIGEFRAAAQMTSEGWPLWYQFAAIAYDWDVKRDVLNAGVAHGEEEYPAEAARELWLAITGVAADLERERVTVPPRLELDPALHVDRAWQADVRKALRGDGGATSVRHPSPFCRDKKTGKLRVPRPRCDKDGRGPINPLRPGERLACDNDGECDVITIRDPFEAMGSGLGTLVAIGLVIWLSLEK